MFDRKTLSAALLVAAAFAQNPAQAQTAQVRYKVAELKTFAGQQAVTERLRRAVRRACYDHDSIATLSTSRRCMAELGGQMVAKIDHPVVSALWSGQAPVRQAALSSTR